MGTEGIKNGMLDSKQIDMFYSVKTGMLTIIATTISYKSLINTLVSISKSDLHYTSIEQCTVCIFLDSFNLQDTRC